MQSSDNECSLASALAASVASRYQGSKLSHPRGCSYQHHLCGCHLASTCGPRRSSCHSRAQPQHAPYLPVACSPACVRPRVFKHVRIVQCMPDRWRGSKREREKEYVLNARGCVGWWVAFSVQCVRDLRLLHMSAGSNCNVYFVPRLTDCATHTDKPTNTNTNTQTHTRTHRVNTQAEPCKNKIVSKFFISFNNCDTGRLRMSLTRILRPIRVDAEQCGTAPFSTSAHRL